MKSFTISLLFTLILLSSCRKEEATFNKFLLSNNLGVTIKILPTIHMIDTLILLNNESKEYDLSYQRGLSTGISYASIIDARSTTVIVNNTDTIIHYYDTLTHTGRYYKPSSARSFYNTASYEKDIVNDTKYLRTVTLKYIFTPQDYLDAKKQLYIKSCVCINRHNSLFFIQFIYEKILYFISLYYSLCILQA